MPITVDDNDDDAQLNAQAQIRGKTPPALYELNPFDEQELQNIVNEVQETASFSKLNIDKIGKCDVPFCLYPTNQCVRPKTTVIFKPALTPSVVAYLMTSCEKHAIDMLEKMIDGTKEQKFTCRLFLYDLVKLAVRLKLKPQHLMYLMEIFMDGVRVFFVCRNTTQQEMESYYEERIINHAVDIPGSGTKIFKIPEVEEITKLFGRFIRLMPLLFVYFYRPMILKWTMPLYQPSDNRDCISDTNLRIDPNTKNQDKMYMDNMPKLFPYQEKSSDCQAYLQKCTKK